MKLRIEKSNEKNSTINGLTNQVIKLSLKYQRQYHPAK